MSSAARHPAGGSGGSGGRGDGARAVELVIEVDGLLQRFGRVVPDVAALLERLVAVREQAGLTVWLGVSVDGEAPADPRVASTIAKLGAETVPLDTHALAQRVAGHRLLAFCGSDATRDALLAAGLVAYRVIDRREKDHRRLCILEADRVVAEALHLDVPRPMSDEARTGRLFACKVSDPAEAREIGTQCLALDPRADWLVLGDTLAIYVECDDAVALLHEHGAQSVGEALSLGSLHLSEKPVANALLMVGGITLGTSAGLPWTDVRRAVLAQPGAAPVGSREHMLHSSDWCALPFAAPDVDRMILLQAPQDTSIERLEELTHHTGEALRKRGIAAALYASRAADPLTELWTAECNNIAVALSAGGDVALPPRPWTAQVHVPPTLEPDLAEAIAGAYPG